MDADSGKDAAALAELVAELAENLGILYGDDPGTAELERSHACTDALEALATMLGIIHPLWQRLVTLSDERHHEAMRRTDELLAASRGGPLPTGGPTP